MQTVNNTGVVSWPKPVASVYQVTVTAVDRNTGLSGKGLYIVAIDAAGTPEVTSGGVSGPPGAALSFSVGVSSANPVTLSLAGAPSGMTISTTGVVTWQKPVAGTFTVTVTARDSKTGLSNQGIYTVKIGTATGPAVAQSTLTGVAGTAFTGTIVITDGGAGLVGIGSSGAPQGMSVAPVNGNMNMLGVSWPKPVAGSYSIQVSATDANGLSANVAVPVIITSH